MQTMTEHSVRHVKVKPIIEMYSSVYLNQVFTRAISIC